MDFKKFTHDDEFHDIVNDENTLRESTEKFLNNIIDEITLGIIFDTHRKFKTNAVDLIGYKPPKQDGGETFDPTVDIFEEINKDKENVEECECPNCNTNVIAGMLAAHLEICMGIISNRYRTTRSTARNIPTCVMETSLDLPRQKRSKDDKEWRTESKKGKKKHNKKEKKKKEKKAKKEKKSSKKSKNNKSKKITVSEVDDMDAKLRKLEFMHFNFRHPDYDYSDI